MQSVLRISHSRNPATHIAGFCFFLVPSAQDLSRNRVTTIEAGVDKPASDLAAEPVVVNRFNRNERRSSWIIFLCSEQADARPQGTRNRTRIRRAGSCGTNQEERTTEFDWRKMGRALDGPATLRPPNFRRADTRRGRQSSQGPCFADRDSLETTGRLDQNGDARRVERVSASHSRNPAMHACRRVFFAHKSLRGGYLDGATLNEIVTRSVSEGCIQTRPFPR